MYKFLGILVIFDNLQGIKNYIEKKKNEIYFGINALLKLPRGCGLKDLVKLNFMNTKDKSVCSSTGFQKKLYFTEENLKLHFGYKDI